MAEPPKLHYCIISDVIDVHRSDATNFILSTHYMQCNPFYSDIVYSMLFFCCDLIFYDILHCNVFDSIIWYYRRFYFNMLLGYVFRFDSILSGYIYNVSLYSKGFLSLYIYIYIYIIRYHPTLYIRGIYMYTHVYIVRKGMSFCSKVSPDLIYIYIYIYIHTGTS